MLSYLLVLILYIEGEGLAHTPVMTNLDRETCHRQGAALVENLRARDGVLDARALCIEVQNFSPRLGNLT